MVAFLVAQSNLLADTQSESKSRGSDLIDDSTFVLGWRDLVMRCNLKQTWMVIRYRFGRFGIMS